MRSVREEGEEGEEGEEVVEEEDEEEEKEKADEREEEEKEKEEAELRGGRKRGGGGEDQGRSIGPRVKGWGKSTIELTVSI